MAASTENAYEMASNADVATNIAADVAALPKSQLHVDSMTSAILATVFIPPMPVVCLRGQSGELEDAMASSHDLLNRVIAVHAVEQRWASDLERDLLVKQDVMREMHTAIRRCVLERVAVQCDDEQSDEKLARGIHSVANSEEVLGKCYAIFQDAFRKYMSSYSMTHADLRIGPMSSVPREHHIIKQAIEHIKAIDAGFEDERVRPGLDCTSRYRDLLAVYVEMLASMEE